MLDLRVFVAWQFLAACIAVTAIVSAIKSATLAARPELMDRHAFKVFLAVQNLIWGVMVTAALRFPRGESHAAALVVGLCAGAVSQNVYTIVLKRLGALAGVVGAGDAVPDGPSEEQTDPQRPSRLPPPGGAAAQ